MNPPSQEEDLVAIGVICESTVERLFAAAELINTQARTIEQREPAVAAALKAASTDILEACNFQDIVGQLVARLRQGVSSNPLLQGPAVGSSASSQDDVDALWKTSGA